MSEFLPERPDLDQLRRRAKELRDGVRRGDAEAAARFARHHDARGAAGLAAAQLVIARELGFASWPRLKAAVDASAASRNQVSAFLTASIQGPVGQAAELLRTDPGIARGSLLAAAVLGDVDTVRGMLTADPAAALAVDDERGWPPLLYACYSRWHRIEPDRASGLAGVVRLLLDAGASPNTNDGGRLRYRSALRGSVEVNNPAVAEVLLDAGAAPDPGQPIGEAAGYGDHRCLQLLLAHGARVERTWALGAAIAADDPVALSMLLAALGPDRAAEAATGALAEAVTDASLPVVVALLEAGADPRATDSDGMSTQRLAVRTGKTDVAQRLRELGADDDSTDVDRFLGSCRRGNRRAAEELLAAHPDLPDRLTDHDRSALFDAAARGTAESVALFLDLGFSPSLRNHDGEQPLHTAAYFGNAPAVRRLLDAGAGVDARDDRFEATPLAFATVGSGERIGEPGDWVGIATMLLEAGASRDEVWISGKPPSDEVVAVLRRYGVEPDEPTGQRSEVEPEADGSIGTGVMAEIAAHLEAAYREGDLELLGSLLHPEVTWTGLCRNRDQVLDWYRDLRAQGTTVRVDGVEVDRDAVVLGLAVALRAEGARPAPAQHVHQVFVVDDAQIVDIRGYPDRASALQR